MFAALWVTHPS